MAVENKVIREAPSVVYKVTQVSGGRAPKTEVTVRLGGDFSKLKTIEFSPVLKRLREQIKAELKEWESNGE